MTSTIVGSVNAHERSNRICWRYRRTNTSGRTICMNAFIGPTTALATASEFVGRCSWNQLTDDHGKECETISVIATMPKEAQGQRTPMLISRDAVRKGLLLQMPRKYQGNCDLDCCEEISVISGNVTTARALGSPSSTSVQVPRDELTIAIPAAEKKPYQGKQQSYSNT